MTLTTLLTVFVSVVVFMVFALRPKKGAPLLLVAVLFLPYLTISDISFRAELVLVPVLLFVLLTRRLHRGLALPPVVLALMIFWAWILLVTVVQAIYEPSSWETSLFSVSTYTFLRPLLIVVLFYNLAFDHDDALKLVRVFVYSAIPLSLMVLGQSMGNDLTTRLTVAAYTTARRTPIENLLEEIGTIVRGVGVFESPVYAAIYFLMALGSGLLLLLMQPTERGAWKRQLAIGTSIFMAFLGGIFTGSATFISGVAVLFAWILLRLNLQARFRFATVGVALVVPLFLSVRYLLEGNSLVQGNLLYQLERVLTFTLFETRYNIGTGLLDPLVAAVGERPLVGWGWTAQEGVFLGDSIYLVILYYGGLIGLGLYAFALWEVARHAFRTGSFGAIVLLWLVLLLATGVGAPSFFAPRLQDWWWAMVGVVLYLHNYEFPKKYWGSQ